MYFRKTLAKSGWGKALSFEGFKPKIWPWNIQACVGSNHPQIGEQTLGEEEAQTHGKISLSTAPYPCPLYGFDACLGVHACGLSWGEVACLG